MSETAAFPFRV